jgi:hypothetical protein
MLLHTLSLPPERMKAQPPLLLCIPVVGPRPVAYVAIGLADRSCDLRPLNACVRGERDCKFASPLSSFAFSFPVCIGYWRGCVCEQ